MGNPKAMCFSKDIDTTEAKGEHKFYFSFSKNQSRVVYDCKSLIYFI